MKERYQTRTGASSQKRHPANGAGSKTSRDRNRLDPRADRREHSLPQAARLVAETVGLFREPGGVLGVLRAGQVDRDVQQRGLDAGL